MALTGRLITFEGIDGSGKSTQLRRLAQSLTAAGYEVITTREPGGTPLGTRLRAALLDGEPGSVDPLAELLLYAADRAQHIRQLVRPALEAGRIVLSDRFYDATVAYQGHGRGFPLALIHQLNQLATEGLTPDLTLVYDLDVAVGLARTHDRQTGAASDQPDRLDREPSAFHQRVRAGYHALIAADPRRCRAVPATGTVEEVFALTWREVATIIPLPRSV
ncbi:MAG: dTMP kinase [Acidobacteriota bacterium]|jgi:dTMP kinase